MLKSINIVWLSKASLSNINAGEGSSNITELKTYGKDKKPYASGQSVRHALRESMMRENFDEFKCVPELPCGDVENCWLCDLFGYLDPKKGEGFNRRWSSLKVSPALGQIKTNITTDMLTRSSILESKGNQRKYEEIDKLNELKEKINKNEKIETQDLSGLNLDKEKKDLILEEDESIEDKINAISENIGKIEEKIKKSKDQRIAYTQIIENVYKTGISIDYANIGKVIAPKGTFAGKKTDLKFEKWEEINNVDNDVRKSRAIAVLQGIMNLSDFAKQARNMISSSPDVVIISLQDKYNQRLARALDLNDSGKINQEELEVILKDVSKISLKDKNGNPAIFIGYTPNVIINEDKFFNAVQSSLSYNKEIIETPFEAICSAITYIKDIKFDESD